MAGRQRNLRTKLIAIAGLCCILLTGCWDRLEIEERAVVLGIGIDEAEKGAEQREEEITHLRGTFPKPKTGAIRVSIQIAVPGRIPLGPGGSGGGGGGGGGGGQNTVWVVEGEGYTINEALNNLQQRISPALFYGHLRIIAVSEKIAKKGIENLNDFFRRNPEIRRMSWMIISGDKASELMKASPQLERVPTIYLMSTMDQAVKMGRLPNDFLGLFWSASSAKGKEGFLPYVSLKQQGTVEINGLAYFKNDKMVGKTKPLEIPLYMGIIGSNPAGGEVFVRVPGTSDYVLFGGRYRKSIIHADLKNGKPHISVKIYVEGNLLEKSNEQVPITTDTIKQIEKELSENARQAYIGLIKATQEKGSDIFGFGEQIRAKQWRYWNKEIQTKEKWQSEYKNLTVDVNVQMHIRRVGMKAK